MFTEGELSAMQGWVLAAHDWSQASQAFVGTAASLALSSRTLADKLHANDGKSDPATGVNVDTLQDELRLLADTIEHESAEARDAYLATAARIETYGELFD